jgi:hypothetical protein
MQIVDGLLGLVHEATDDAKLALKFNKYYIGLARDGIPDNFVTVRPRKSRTVFCNFRLARSDELSTRLEDAGVDVSGYDTRHGLYQIRLTESDLDKNGPIILDMLRRASGLSALETSTGTA